MLTKLLLSEQKGNASNTNNILDQLIINKMVMDNIKIKQQNISKVWIDCKKVFIWLFPAWLDYRNPKYP